MSSKYTTQQRIEAYTYALLFALSDMDTPKFSNGLCESIAEWQSETEDELFDHSELRKQDYPEFFKSRPKKLYGHGVWFGFDEKEQEKRVNHIGKVLNNTI